MTEQNDTLIFLSYARADEDRVIPVYNYLTKAGFQNCWMDIKKILPGQLWDIEIQRNLGKADIVIVFLSNTSVNKRGYVQKELKKALDYLAEKLTDDIYIIPIKLDSDVTIPEEISKIQFLDINDVLALTLLKDSIHSQIQKMGGNPPNNSHSLDEVYVHKRSFCEKWEGLPGYEVEFTIPYLQSAKFENISEIQKIIEAAFIETLQQYRKNKLEQAPDVYSWSQDNFLRTDTFDAHYNLTHKNYYIGIQYSIAWYGAGAAHPNYHFETYNFILSPLIQIKDLPSTFNNPEIFFEHFISYVRQKLLEIPWETDENGKATSDEKMLDLEWVISGTESWEMLKSFVYTDEGLELFFPPYQVGGYALGAHTITIPYNVIYNELTNNIKHALNLPYMHIEEQPS